MSNEMTGLTPSQVFKLMIGHFKSGDYKTNLYLEGHHGIGKTEMVLQAALEVFGTEEQKKMPLSEVLAMSYEERGWVFERDYPATKNVEDYTGVPRYNSETGCTDWGTPNFYPRVGKGVYVIEELNQAAEEVLKAHFPLLQDRRIGAHKLSPEVYVVITGNPPNGVHHVVDFSIALKDRMQRIGVLHSAKDWVKWAKVAGGIHPAIIGFIEDNPNMMHVIPDDGSQGPTPRAWEAVSCQLYKLEKGFIEEFMLVEMMKNRVGGQAATRCLGHWKNYAKRAVSAEELLEDYDKYLPRFKEQSPAGKAESVDAVMIWVEKNIASLTKDSAQLIIVKELFTKEVANGILVAKAMSITPETINKLVQMGPAGVAIGQKLAGIRHTAEQDRTK
jgi:hypothetical protein